MLGRLRTTLRGLRKSLSRKAEQAYDDRDAAWGNPQAEAYAEGEGHAYGIAEEEVRDAEKKNE